MFHKHEIQIALNSVKVLLKELTINYGKMPQFCILISQLHFHVKQASSHQVLVFSAAGRIMVSPAPGIDDTPFALLMVFLLILGQTML